MKHEPLLHNAKPSALGLVGRYKVRQLKNFNINLKPIQCDNNIFFKIDDNCTPFTINSRNLPDYTRQLVVNQVAYSKQRPSKKVFSEDNKRMNKSQTKIPTLPNASSHKTQSIAGYDRDHSHTQQKRKKMFSQRQYHSQQTNNKIKRCTCGKCEQCMKDFAYYLHLCSDQRGVPQISAKSWCIWKMKDEKFYYYYGKRIHKVREIASLTKITTAMVLVDYANKFSFQLAKTKFEVRKTSGIVGGTTAKLNVGEIYTLKELLYGMMLPSGNDAAVAISEAVGLMISMRQKNKQFDPHSSTWYQQNQSKSSFYLFINAMNEKVQKLGAIDTKFYNPHGNDAFDQQKNVSTCNQIAKISAEFMKYHDLREVVKTTEFTFENGTKIENTNKLLQDGFEGIKTGITQTAGPCLSAFYKDLIIVVLNSKSMDSRWIEVKKLVKWIRQRF